MSDSYFVNPKKVASGGYFHLLRAPLGTTAAKEHHSNAPFLSGVAAGAEQAPHVGRCLCGGGGKEDNENQWDVLITHCALDSFIGINN